MNICRNTHPWRPVHPTKPAGRGPSCCTGACNDKGASSRFALTNCWRGIRILLQSSSPRLAQDFHCGMADQFVTESQDGRDFIVGKEWRFEADMLAPASAFCKTNPVHSSVFQMRAQESQSCPLMRHGGSRKLIGFDSRPQAKGRELQTCSPN